MQTVKIKFNVDGWLNTQVEEVNLLERPPEDPDRNWAEPNPYAWLGGDWWAQMPEYAVQNGYSGVKIIK